jgi:cell division transport system permease protein
MFWVNLKRILKSGASNFWRNGIVSLSSILVMAITLLILSFVLFTNAIVNHTLISLKNSVDVSINLLDGAAEERIMALTDDLEKLSDVESVEYVSKDQALDNFIQRNSSDNPRLLAIVKELPENPILAYINIKATEIDKYESIQNFLNQNYPEDKVDSIIKNINYANKQVVIDRLLSITSATEFLGIFIMVVFLLLSILITLNTIRLTIFISREEIKLMNLVGASRFYISGPFMVVGGMYGAISAILILIVMYPITYLIGPRIKDAFFDFNLFSYYISNFGTFFVILFFSGVIIGVISSSIATKKYLKN